MESIEEFFSSGVAAVFHDILKLALILVVLLVVIDVQLAMCDRRWCMPLPRRARLDGSSPVAAGATSDRVRTEVAATNTFTTEAIRRREP